MTNVTRGAFYIACVLVTLELAPAVLQAQIQAVILHNFDGADGLSPNGLLVMPDAVYGTTYHGGTGCSSSTGCGVVYKFDAADNFTVLYQFTGGADGASPLGSLVSDGAGNLYGAAQVGGSGVTCCGVVYKLDSSGQQTVLHTFSGRADGGDPVGLARDAAGNLYGTTGSGGRNFFGEVFKIDTAGQFTVLYDFTDTHGSGLVSDSVGNLYGTQPFGGSSNSGDIYKIDSAGHYTELYSFSGTTDGYEPLGVVLVAGNLYGATEGGGSAGGPKGFGVLFKLDQTGHETVLYNFQGQYPNTSLTRDAAGNLYGATSSADVFRLNPAGQYSVFIYV